MYNGNKTEWSLGIIRVIVAKRESDLLRKVSNRNYHKHKLKHKIFRKVLASSERKPFKCVHDGAYHPITAQLMANHISEFCYRYE